MNPHPKRLYDFPFSGNGYKVRLALAYLGLSIEYNIVDLIARETKAPDFLAKNPMGEIPLLELSDGSFLRESNAIVFWLAEGTALMPDDRLDRARVVQWMMFEQNNIDKVLGRTRFLKRWPQFIETTQADWDGWYAAGDNALAILDAELGRHDFAVGNAYSAADICLYGYVHCADEGGFDLPRYAHIHEWTQRVRAQDGYLPIDELP